VSRKQRRKGIARMLMLETEKRAPSASATLMNVGSGRSNQGRIDLYREFDYAPVDVRPNYYVDEGEDAIVMVKELKRPGVTFAVFLRGREAPGRLVEAMSCD